MAKNIVIAEGGTAKNFTAKKLQTNLQGSGRVNWIPEDEAVDYVDIKDHTFRAAGTFKPEDFNCDGFGEVTIDIPADVKPKTITKNGEFYAADDGCLGYSKVTVAVPTGGGGGPYTVRFFGDDRQTILKTDANVPYGGSASCTDLDGTILNGLYFKGWNPSPTNVKADINCYPIRGDYIIDGQEISDDWQTICANKGANYPLGAYKALVFDMPATTDDILAVWKATYGSNMWDWRSKPQENYTTYAHVEFHMVKVAEGEDGSTSTWLSTGCINFPNSPQNILQVNDGTGWRNTSTWKGIDEAIINPSGQGAQHWYGNFEHDWGESRLRYFLNHLFFDNLMQCLKDTIKSVNKDFWGLTSIYTSAGRVQKTSIDKIWVPSVKELSTLLSTYTIASSYMYPNTFEGICESNGVDYAQVYVPTYPSAASPNWYITRSVNSAVSGSILSSWITPHDEDDTINSYYRRTGSITNRIPIGFCL